MVVEDGCVVGFGTAFNDELPAAARDAADTPAHTHDQPVPVRIPPLPAPALRVVSVCAGASHAVAVAATGAAWAWGRGKEGQLGRDVPGWSASTPQRVPVDAAVAIQSAAAGGHHTLLVDGGGAVWGCGANTHGQLGVPACARVTAPTAAVGLSRIVCVAAGAMHSAAVGYDGRVWTMGWGLYGQLGHGDTDSAAVPTVVDALADVGGFKPDGTARGAVAVACGAWHTVVLSAIGDVYTCGWGKHGQLGHKYDTAGAAADGSGAVLLVDSAMETEPRLVDTLADTHVVAVAAGAKHCVAVSAAGQLWEWGAGGDGGAEDGGAVTALPRRREWVGKALPIVACGQSHTLVVGSGPPAPS